MFVIFFFCSVLLMPQHQWRTLRSYFWLFAFIVWRIRCVHPNPRARAAHSFRSFFWFAERLLPFALSRRRMLYDYWHNMFGLLASLICFYVHTRAREHTRQRLVVCWMAGRQAGRHQPLLHVPSPISHFAFGSVDRLVLIVCCLHNEWMRLWCFLSHSHSPHQFIFFIFLPLSAARHSRIFIWQRHHSSIFLIHFYFTLWFYSFLFIHIFCGSHLFLLHQSLMLQLSVCSTVQEHVPHFAYKIWMINWDKRFLWTALICRFIFIFLRCSCGRIYGP